MLLVNIKHVTTSLAQTNSHPAILYLKIVFGIGDSKKNQPPNKISLKCFGKQKLANCFCPDEIWKHFGSLGMRKPKLSEPFRSTKIKVQAFVLSAANMKFVKVFKG